MSVQLVNVDSDDETPELLEELSEVTENKEQDYEINVLLVKSPTEQKKITMMANADHSLEEIIETVSLTAFKNRTFVCRFDILELTDPQYEHKYDYIFQVVNYTEDDSSKLNVDDSLRDKSLSQSSTKINFFNLSDKENEETPTEEEKSCMVRASSVESINSSRSPSPEPKKDDGEASIGTIQLNDSSGVENVVNRNSRSGSKSTKSNILTIYPPPPENGGISISTKDYECLASDEFLNDVIIDFYLSYLMREVVSAADRQRTHLFSSHFYTRFAKPYKNGDESTFADDDEKRHAGVQRWTKNVNIFEKDFIIIPVNEHSHWYLVIICFPYLVGNVDEESYELHENEKPDQVHRPCILLFDSLYSKKTAVITKLRGYLSCEYFAKNGIKKSFSDLRFNRLQVPKQSNATDCGLFLLQYVESFFKDPISNFSSPIKNLGNWFEEEDVIVGKREEIAKLIGKLATDFHNGEEVDLPNIVFPKKRAIRPVISDDNDDSADDKTWFRKTKSESAKTKRSLPKLDIIKENGPRKAKRSILRPVIDDDDDDDSMISKPKNHKRFSKRIDSSSEEEIEAPVHKKSSDRRLAEQNKLHSNDDKTKNKTPKQEKTSSSIKSSHLKSTKTAPCYANSSHSPVVDELPFSSKNKSSVKGSPPYYCMPSESIIKRKRKLFPLETGLVDLGEASNSPVRVLKTPFHMQSRSQKILGITMRNNSQSPETCRSSYSSVSSIIANPSDPFYSMHIGKKR